MKLLLQGVEVTTSLSNSSIRNESRQIKIKPISLQRNDQPKSELEAASKQETLLQEIEQAQIQLKELKNQSQQLLEETEAEIESKKQAWETEKQTYIEAASKQGFSQGYTDGESKSLAKYKSDLEKANQIIDTARKDYQALIEDNVDTILEIALHTAEKITKQKIDEEPNSFLEIINAAIKELKDQSVISIYLHPNQYESVVQHKEELVTIIEKDAKLALYVTDEVEDYGCMIKHPFGQINASVDTQLQEIRQILFEVSEENRQ